MEATLLWHPDSKREREKEANRHMAKLTKHSQSTTTKGEAKLLSPPKGGGAQLMHPVNSRWPWGRVV